MVATTLLCSASITLTFAEPELTTYTSFFCGLAATPVGSMPTASVLTTVNPRTGSDVRSITETELLFPFVT